MKTAGGNSRREAIWRDIGTFFSVRGEGVGMFKKTCGEKIDRRTMGGFGIPKADYKLYNGMAMVSREKEGVAMYDMWIETAEI